MPEDKDRVEAKLENIAKRLLSMPPKPRTEAKAPHKPQAELKVGKAKVAKPKKAK
jgi:hypothetical protein